MKRKALGKGLRSLIPEAPAKRAETTHASATAVAPAAGEEARQREAGGLVAIDLDRISPNRNQPRRGFDEQALETLAASLREHGVLQPIVVRPAGDRRFEIVAGERRWRAAQRAGLLKLPAVVRHVSDGDLLEVALVENLQREDLSPIEEASAYRTLIDELGLTQEEVAQRVGRQRATVTNILRLLTLPPRVQDLVQSGELSAGHAKALAAIGSPRAQVAIAERIVREGLSVRQAEALAGRNSTGGVRRAGASSIPGVRDPNVVAAEQSLQRLLGTRVRIAERGRGGQVEIRYHDGEELRRIYDLLVDRASPPTQ